MRGKLSFTPTFVQLANRARKLREWTRFGIYEGDSASHQELQSQSAHEARQNMNRKVDQIARDQRMMNNFYKELGFPTLPKNHTVARYWEKKISQKRKAVERQKSARKAAVNRTTERKKFEKAQREGNEQLREGYRSSEANSAIDSTHQRGHKN